MSSVPLKIELTPQAQKIVAGFPTLPGRIVAAIAKGMQQANQVAVANIKSKHLTGKGPFPPEEHKLGNVTWTLRGSVWATEPQQTAASQVQSAIGSPIKYAAIHEFGGRIHHPARQMKVRHKVDARGNLVKQLGNSNLLMFAKAGTKRVRTTTVQAKAYDVDVPERAPFRTGIAETLPTYKTLMSRGIVEAWKQLSS